jgi:ribosome recycling factor
MPEEYMKSLKEEADEKIQDDHLKFVEAEIDKLPEEAFEKRNKVNNSMANLNLNLDL